MIKQFAFYDPKKDIIVIRVESSSFYTMYLVNEDQLTTDYYFEEKRLKPLGEL